jgi:hypothetical protein
MAPIPPCRCSLDSPKRALCQRCRNDTNGTAGVDEPKGIDNLASTEAEKHQVRRIIGFGLDEFFINICKYVVKINN